MEPPPTALPVPDAAPAIDAAGLQPDVAADETNSAWRHELSARLTRYRARRKAPPPRYPSLKLPFDAIGSPARATEAAPAPIFETASNHALALDGMVQEASLAEENPVPPSPEVSTEVPAAPVRRSAGQTSAKIIEFPRFAWGPPPPHPINWPNQSPTARESWKFRTWNLPLQRWVESRSNPRRWRKSKSVPASIFLCKVRRWACGSWPQWWMA